MTFGSTAFHQLGDESAVAALYAAQEMTPEEWRAVSRMHDWPRLASDGPEAWKAAAESLLGPGSPDAVASAKQEPAAGPLEQDQMLVDQSAATRGAISALLEAVKSPQALTQ